MVVSVRHVDRLTRHGDAAGDSEPRVQAYDPFLLRNHGPQLTLLTIQQEEAHPIRFEQFLGLNRNQLQKRNDIPYRGHPFAYVKDRTESIRLFIFTLGRRDLESRHLTLVHRLLPNTSMKVLSTKVTRRQRG